MLIRFPQKARPRRTAQRVRASALVAVEMLEDLQLLSASPALSTIAIPLLSAASGPAGSSSGQANALATNVAPMGHSPAQIAQAYGFNQVNFDNGAIAGNGAGQTIAIVDAYYAPTIASDLQKFDAQFGLAAPPSLTQYVEQGATVDSGWALETALDVEWAHAMAPGANIDLIEANNSSLGSLLSAVNFARNLPSVSVVSMSWGTSEFAAETQFDSLFTTPSGHIGITFVASAGDAGAGTTWPSVSPNVLAVGGTSLTTSGSGAYVGESAWSGSGGGVSLFESEPSYQSSVQSTGSRTTPDVAYDADPYSGFAVYDSIPYAGENGWFEVGGTSAGAPQWAALIAIADQGLALSGEGTLSNAQATLYTLPSSDFHNITSGSNGSDAMSGYNLVTGRGSPVANSIIEALSGQNTATSPAAVTATTATTTTSSTSTTHSNPPTSGGPTAPTGPSDPGRPTAPTNPTLPTKAEESRGVLAADVLAQPNVTPVLGNGGYQVGAIAVSSATVPLAADRFEMPTSVTSTITGLPDTDNLPTIAATNSTIVSASSVAAGGLSQRAELSAALPSIADGWSKFSPVTVFAEHATAAPVVTADSDEIAEPATSFGGGSPVDDASDNAIPAAAIDALFMNNGWLMQATNLVDPPPTSSSLGKTALAGLAASAGAFGLLAAIRRRRQASTL